MALLSSRKLLSVVSTSLLLRHKLLEHSQFVKGIQDPFYSQVLRIPFHSFIVSSLMYFLDTIWQVMVFFLHRNFTFGRRTYHARYTVVEQLVFSGRR